MRVGVIGSGKIGVTLARLLVDATLAPLASA